MSDVPKFELEINPRYENRTVRLPIDIIDTINSLAGKTNQSFSKVILKMINFSLAHMDSLDK